MTTYTTEPYITDDQVDGALKTTAASMKILRELKKVKPEERFRVLRAVAVIQGMDTSIPVFEAFQHKHVTPARKSRRT